MFKKVNHTHKVFLLFFLTFLIGTPEDAFALNLSSDPNAKLFRESVNQILSHSCLKHARIGIKMRSLERKDSLYEKNGDHLFIPASNVKLLTTAAALRKLGPGFRFLTRIYANGPINGRTLEGDLFIKGYGDPKLVTEEMWILANQVKDLPVNKVKGNLIADDTYFDDELRIKTWKKEWGPEAYNAPLGALSFNFNTVAVDVMPGAKSGDRPVLVLNPDVDYFRVNNAAVTLPPNRWRGRLVVNRVEENNYDEIKVSGRISRNVKRQRFFLNITDPTQYAAKVFRKNLAQAGVTISGRVRRGRVPKMANLLVEHKSEPLSEIIRGLNKHSNNFIAEQILKTLGAELIHPPGTTEKGLQVIREYMKSLGYFPHQYVVLDGSGLSRGSRLSPEQIISILEDVYSDMSVYPEFIAALGVMGHDGSVKERMQNNKEAGKVRVKTGTLNNVSALSGYFQSRDGERFAFSMLMNNLRCSNGRIIDLQDEIINRAIEFKRSQ